MQTHSGKSGCLKDEVDLLRTPNENTGDIYNIEMHTLTSFVSVLLTMYRRSMYSLSVYGDIGCSSTLFTWMKSQCTDA